MKYVETKNNENYVIVDSLKELMSNHKFIGFESDDGTRYMIVGLGPARGMAVRATGTFSGREFQQDRPMSQYCVFNKKDELYEWMKGE